MMYGYLATSSSTALTAVGAARTVVAPTVVWGMAALLTHRNARMPVRPRQPCEIKPCLIIASLTLSESVIRSPTSRRLRTPFGMLPAALWSLQSRCGRVPIVSACNSGLVQLKRALVQIICKTRISPERLRGTARAPSMFFPEVRQPSGSLRGELQAECAHDLKHSAEPRIAVLRQRLIEPLAGQARVLRKLHHAAGARDVTKRLCQQRRVIRRFLETCLEVGHHIGFGFEVVSSVPAREAAVGSLRCYGVTSGFRVFKSPKRVKSRSAVNSSRTP